MEEERGTGLAGEAWLRKGGRLPSKGGKSLEKSGENIF
jgi:hypothetical protein